MVLVKEAIKFVSLDPFFSLTDCVSVYRNIFFGTQVPF